MRMILLSALFGLGVGLAGAPAASAAPLGGGLNGAATNFTPIEQVAVRCRRTKSCWRNRHGRTVCQVRRVCVRY